LEDQSWYVSCRSPRRLPDPGECRHRDRHRGAGVALHLDGFLKPGEQHKRNVLLETIYASLPHDPQVKVLVFSAKIMPGRLYPLLALSGHA
jgi:hypothetical protein